jgi:tetratricopeptide (TPR) repeat protein
MAIKLDWSNIGTGLKDVAETIQERRYRKAVEAERGLYTPEEVTESGGWYDFQGQPVDVAPDQEPMEGLTYREPSTRYRTQAGEFGSREEAMASVQQPSRYDQMLREAELAEQFGRYDRADELYDRAKDVRNIELDERELEAKEGLYRAQIGAYGASASERSRKQQEEQMLNAVLSLDPNSPEFMTVVDSLPASMRGQVYDLANKGINARVGFMTTMVTNQLPAAIAQGPEAVESLLNQMTPPGMDFEVTEQDGLYSLSVLGQQPDGTARRTTLLPDASAAEFKQFALDMANKPEEIAIAMQGYMESQEQAPAAMVEQLTEQLKFVDDEIKAASDVLDPKTRASARDRTAAQQRLGELQQQRQVILQRIPSLQQQVNAPLARRTDRAMAPPAVTPQDIDEARRRTEERRRAGGGYRDGGLVRKYEKGGWVERTKAYLKDKPDNRENRRRLENEERAKTRGEYLQEAGEAFSGAASRPAGALERVDLPYDPLSSGEALEMLRRSRMQMPEGLQRGGQVKQYPRGGDVKGKGTATSDSIPAMLSDGEFVVNAESMKIPGVPEILEAINKAGLKRRDARSR